MSHKYLRSLAVLVLLASVGGCVEQPRKMTAKEKEAVKPFILSKKPDIAHPLNVNLENHVTLLGYDVKPDKPLEPGQSFTMTFYWEVKKPLDDGWLLFTHVEDAKNAPRVNADSDGMIRKHYPPGKWQQGEIIKDQQRITLPKEWDSPTATIKTGVWFGPHRLQVLQGPHDEENRVIAAVLETTVKAREEKPLTLEVPRAGGEVTVDGKLDEEAWKTAVSSEPMVAPQNGGKMLPETRFRLMWDDEFLYVGYDAPDDHLHCEFEERDDAIYNQDAVEIFLDPDGDGKNYYEIQICPAGVIFDSLLTSYRANAKDPECNEWDSEMEAKVSTDGTLNDKEDVDTGYTAEFAIPFKDLEHAPNIPPRVGDTWKVNFFRLDDAKGGKKAWAWSPPMNNDFHNLGRFGVLKFVDNARPADPEEVEGEEGEKGEEGEEEGKDEEAAKDSPPKPAKPLTVQPPLKFKKLPTKKTEKKKTGKKGTK